MSKNKEMIDEQIEITKKKLTNLKEENKKLKDELDSLWAMMDEMTKSDIKNWSHLTKELNQNIMAKALMITNKKADC